MIVLNSVARSVLILGVGMKNPKKIKFINVADFFVSSPTKKIPEPFTSNRHGTTLKFSNNCVNGVLGFMNLCQNAKGVRISNWNMTEFDFTNFLFVSNYILTFQ